MNILGLKAISLLIAVAIGMFGSCNVVNAGNISVYANGPWLQFGWSGATPTEAKGCRPADPNGLPCFSFDGIVAADTPPWTLDVGPAGAFLTITDAFSTGDQFELFDSGSSLGITSNPTEGFDCGSDPDICLADPNASSGVFSFGQGSHELTILVTQSAFTGGAAFFRIDGDVSVIPIPATVWLFGSGLLGLISVARRKKA